MRGDLRSRAEGVDLVLGGIPCEWLSVYRNKGLGNDVDESERDNQRALLDGVLGLVRELDPAWWCLEDVVGLIDELPILTPYQVLDARHFSPQRRKRVFVGRFPRVRRIGNDELLQDRLRRGPYRIGPRAADRKPQRSRTFTRDTTLGAWPADKAPTVLSQCSRRDAECVVVDDSLPSGQRQFEWQEMASLQGFPDDYVFYGSPTDVAKMVGRAIQIDLGRSILKAICRSAGAEIPRSDELIEA